MCRLYGFRANEETKLECSLVYARNALLAQSRQDEQGLTHPDGWGIAYYEDEEQKLEKRVTAAFEGPQFSLAAERVYSCTVLAHVRQATVGIATEVNVHPFVFGRWTFAHNGTVTGFDEVGPWLQEQTDPALLRRRSGSTDSELVFYWLLSRMGGPGADSGRALEETTELMRLLKEAVLELAERCAASRSEEEPKLNFLLTDGHRMVASRLGRSLYWVERKGLHDCEFCGIPHIQHDRKKVYRAVVIASEPITDEVWSDVPDGSVISVDEELNTRVERL